MRDWAGLHVSGILLIVFLAGHLAAVHYAGEAAAETYRFSAVSARLENPLYRACDLGLLVLALFHGLTGTHRFVVDLGVCGAKSLRLVRFLLIALGAAGLAYGILIFRAFVI